MLLSKYPLGTLASCFLFQRWLWRNMVAPCWKFWVKLLLMCCLFCWVQISTGHTPFWTSQLLGSAVKWRSETLPEKFQWHFSWAPWICLFGQSSRVFKNITLYLINHGSSVEYWTEITWKRFSELLPGHIQANQHSFPAPLPHSCVSNQNQFWRSSLWIYVKSTRVFKNMLIILQSCEILI